MSDEKPRIEISWVQSAAGALAAVTSAVLLSTVGVAGTLIGAALGSLAATVGSAVYSYSLRRTHASVAAAQTVAAARIGLAQSRVRQASVGVAAGRPDAEHQLAEADDQLDRAQTVLEDAAPSPSPEAESDSAGWRQVLAGLPWKRIVAVTTALFVTAMAVILAFELVSGRAVSSYTGGSDDRRTSIPGLNGGGGATDRETPADQREPADEASPEETPADEATEPAPEQLDAPESTPTEEPPAPDETVTPTPTPTPATESTPAPTPADPGVPVPEP